MSPNHGSKAAIGIDVGGTAVKGGLVTSSGQVLARQVIETQTAGGVDHVIQRLADLIEHLRKQAQAMSHGVEAVGLGMPGTLSRRRGLVISPPNLPGWRDVPIVQRLEAATGLRVVLDNDANNAALGEYYCGAGRGVGDMAMFTLGTGIGGGLILGGRLWRGALENSGELGHMIVVPDGRPCKCGQRGCLEAYASAVNIAAQVVEAIQAGQPSRLKEAQDRGGALRAEMVVEAAAAGDTLAKRVWGEACRYLAVACVNIQHALSIERIVLAGGMSAAGECLRQPVLAAIRELSSTLLGDPPDVRLAELGNDAGFIGSALSVFHQD